MLPNFLIIGAPRCGTTSLASYIRDHPDVFMAPEKELGFFTGHFDKGLDWYSSRFAGVSAQRSVGEASPRYMYDDAALKRISETLPDVRLIAILRNPIDRAYSHYWMRRARGRESRDFETAVRDELEGTERAAELGRGFPLLKPGCYVEAVSKVLTNFQTDQLLICVLEDFREDAVRAYSGVCRHLGVDSGFIPRNIGDVVNGFFSIRSLTLRRISKSLSPSPRRIVGRFNNRRSEYPPMNARVRGELADFFAPHNERLEALLDRELASWRT